MTSHTAPRLLLICGLVLVAMVVVVYSGSLSVPFFFDDVNSIIENPNIRHLWPLSDALSAPDETSLAGRPVVALSFAISYSMGELDVHAYHAWNMACHALTALLLFGLVRRTLLTERLARSFGSAATGLALAVSLIWLVHPLQTEAVAWAIQRTELMVGLFYLVTLYAAVRGFTSARPRGWLALSVIACLAGMGSKEVMVSAPIMVLLYQRTFFEGSFRACLKRNPGLYAGLGATWLFLGALIASSPRGGSVGFDVGVSSWDYLMTQAQVIPWYLRLAVWPEPLSIYYDWPAPASLADVWLHGGVVVALLAATLLALRRGTALGFLGAWFFLILAPSSSFVPIATEIVAERRMYLPLAAVIALVVMGAYRSARGLTGAGVRKALAASALLLLVGLASVTSVRRVQVYQDTLALWTDTVIQHPGSYQARLGLANVLQAHGRLEEALDQYRKAEKIDSSDARIEVNIGVCLMDLGDVEGALTQFESALERLPDFPGLRNNLGLALAKAGRPEEAVASLERAIQLAPDFTDAHANLALVLINEGRVDEAAEHLAEALRLVPDHPFTLQLLEQLQAGGAPR